MIRIKMTLFLFFSQCGTFTLKKKKHLLFFLVFFNMTLTASHAVPRVTTHTSQEFIKHAKLD